MLNEKELSILNSLYQWNRPTKIEELATAHKLSPRSIRSYVARINQDFPFECVSLKKGYFYLSNPDFLQEFFQNYEVSNYSGQVLVLFMLHKLLLENKIKLSHFVIEFEVSRSTAKNYLNQVKEQIEAYHLKLDHNAGITVLGKEEDKRQMILNLFLHRGERERIAQELLAPLFHPYEALEEGLEEFLQKMLSVLDYSFSAHSYQILFYSLNIMICRLKQGYPPTEVTNQSFLQKSIEYKKTKALFQALEEELSLELPLSEKLELINKVMGLHYSTEKEADHHNWFEYDLFISKLIRRFSKGCGFNLVGDFQLYENLLNHIKPAMYRMAHQIKLHQFDYHYIMEHSPKEYELTKEILSRLHFFPRETTEFQDEIALICVYFKQALDKQKREEKKNVLLISRYGYGSSKMMIEKISQQYHVGKMLWMPSHELKNMDLRQFHLMITTEKMTGRMTEGITGRNSETRTERERDLEPVFPDTLPIVSISPFFQKEDRQKLSLYLSPKEPTQVKLSQVMGLIASHCEVKESAPLEESLCRLLSLEDDREKKPSILDFMTEEMILLEDSSESVQEVLEKAGKLLEFQGCIDSSYTENLIASFENYGIYMTIDQDVAIPHTKNTGNVQKTGFTFVRLRKPISFQKQKLSMFFTFCTSNHKEHLEALILIADLIKDQETKKTLENLASPEEILEFFQMKEKMQEQEDDEEDEVDKLRQEERIT